jgi:uncharacterized membrane protein YfcA
MITWFDAFIGLVAIVAGGIAAVTGFGIGSLLTPALAMATGTKLAVAAIAVPHALGTAARFWMLRRHVDRRVLLGFGVASAAGGLVGALIHSRFTSGALAVVFGGLLILAGVSELTGWMRRVEWGRGAAWVLGALSGLLGGLVGNQGGIRSAALLGFRVSKESLVATATAVSLFVDAARQPVYIATSGREMIALWPVIAVATGGVLLGTVVGTPVLRRLPRAVFSRVIGMVLVALGLYMALTAGGA